MLDEARADSANSVDILVIVLLTRIVYYARKALDFSAGPWRRASWRTIFFSRNSLLLNCIRRIAGGDYYSTVCMSFMPMNYNANYSTVFVMCSIGSLTMALNTLLIDPKRKWQVWWQSILILWLFSYVY